MRSILFGILLSLPAADLAGAAEQLLFDRMTTRDGLSISAIDAIAQGPEGFIWIGTQDGLNRYDGYDFEIFRRGPAAADGLPDNFIRSLYLDASDRLWIGTADGIAEYLPITEGFRQVELPPEHRYVEDIRGDNFGRLWIATRNGLWRINPDDGERELFLAGDGRGLAHSTVRSLAVDSEGVLWVGSAAGLQMYSPRRDQFIRPPVEPWPTELESTRVNDIFEDEESRIWVATRDAGLFQLSPDRRSISNWRHDPDDESSLGDDEVLAVEQDHDGDIWVGTWGGGLDRLQSTGDGFEHHRYEASREDSVAGNLIRSLFVDASGNLWVGTHNLGLSRLDWAQSRFSRIGANPGGHVSLDSPGVFAVLVDRQGRLWVGTVDGIDRFSPDRREVERFNAANGRLPAEFVLGLMEDSEGRIWAGTREDGLCRLEPDAGEFRCLGDNHPGLAELRSNGVVALRPADDGGIWIGTRDGGLRHYQPDSGELREWRHDPDDPDSLAHDMVTGIHEDAGGRLWILTFGGGLDRYLPETDSFRHLSLAEAPDSRAAQDRLVGIAEDTDGGLWIGSVAGLVRYHPDSGELRRWSASDGLPHETIYSVQIDANGDVWASTNFGIARLQPDSGNFTNFSREDGLLDNEFNAFAGFRAADGKLYFGGTNGLSYFDPDDVLMPLPSPSVHLTRLLLANSEVAVVPDGSGLLSSSLAHVDELVLQHDQSVFSIEFTAIEFLQPGGVRFQYRLDGFDQDWLATGPDRRVATYTNLNPGDYTFRVRAAGLNSGWSEEAVLPIRLEPAPFMSPLAYASYLLAVMLVLAYVLRQHWQRLRLLREHARDLAENEQRLQLALWGSGDWLWDWNILTGDVYCAELAQSLGYTPNMSRSLERVYQVIHSEDRDKVQRHIQAELDEQRGLEMSFRVVAKSGEVRWLQWRGKVVSRDENGEPTRMTGTCKDVTRQREAETSLKLADRVLDNSNDAVGIIDLDFNFIKVNPAFTRITGYAPEEVIGQPSTLLDSGKYSAEFSRHLREAVHERGEWQGEIWERRKNGDLYLSDLHLSTVTDENGKKTHMVAVFSDITRRRKFEEELRYLANYDTLTGLPNRTLFIERLSHAIVKARRHEELLAVLFIDLDNFKQVNDSLGHAIGDMLLKQVSARLLKVCHDDDTVARLGGDEFTVILEDLESEEYVETLAQRLLDEFDSSLTIDGRELNVTPSIGISIFPRDGEDGEMLIKNADTAMYAAKEKGRNAYAFYASSMSDSAMGRLQLETLLRRAVARDELLLQYQPKLDLETGKVSGIEALVRWDSGERGLIMPDEFIPLAEERGLIGEIGEWVLRKACSDLAQLDEAGFDELPIAVNLSARQTMDPKLVNTVTNALQLHGIAPQRLQLELTESLIMENAGQTIMVLEDLRQHGVQLVVDDFGTGYSSLSYLKRLPVDQIKVDKSFVQDVLHDEFAVAIIRAIVAMARSLDLLVTAEGVEREAQLELLRELGCTEVQGFLHSPPLALDELKTFLRRQEG